MYKASAYLIISFITLSSICSFGQSGGDHIMEFLNLTHSARATALGGGTLTILDNDVGFGFSNPALLNSDMDGDLSLNQNFHFADIRHGFFNYGHHIDKYNITSQIGINYIDYGTFVRADEFGQRQGEFDAGATAFNFGVGKLLNERMRVGINLKAISARLESYTSFALAADLGMLYMIPDQRIVLGAVIKNIGYPLTAFTQNRGSLPLDIQIGVSKRFEHLPFRLSIIAHRLDDWNLQYDDRRAQTTSILGEVISEPSGLSTFSDNFFKHFIFNGEFLIGQAENFRLRLGYNHLRRKELSVSTFRSLGGFSLGFGLKIKKFRIDYGVGYYHLAGGVNHISISTNLHELRNKI